MSSEARTLILSDTHLGKPGRVSVDSVTAMWHGFDRVIINGDAVEMQLPAYRDKGRRAADALCDTADRMGIELILISGNHDPDISDTHYLRLMDGRVLVTHGGVLDPTIVPWSLSKKKMARLHDATKRIASTEQWRSLDFRHQLTRELAHCECEAVQAKGDNATLTLANAIRHPRKVTRVLAYWMAVPKRVYQFAAQCAPETECFVFGHTHLHCIVQNDRLTMINTGSYDLPGRPRAVVVEGQRLSVHAIRWDQGTYRVAHASLFAKDFEPIEQPQSTVDEAILPPASSDPLAA